MGASPVLTVADVTVRYGGITAVDAVSFTIEPGVIVGLMGPNGAGKTSLIDALTGYAACSGTVVVQGQDLSGKKAHQRARHGLGRTWQTGRAFEDLTVRENVQVGHEAVHSRWVTPHERRKPIDDAVDAALQVTGLVDVADAMPTALSHGRRKLVGVARALAARPHVLLLDEPAAGLDSDETVELGEQLRLLPDAGVTVLLIDHDMTLMMSVCGRIVVLDEGRVIADDVPSRIQRNPAVIDAYLGDTIELAAP